MSEQERVMLDHLIDTARELNIDDRPEFERFRRRAGMILRKLFGKVNEYSGDLERLYFGATVMDASMAEERAAREDVLNDAISIIETAREDRQLTNALTQQDNQKLAEPAKSKQVDEHAEEIFIVHGHDEGMREAVARFVERCGYAPIILHEKINQNRTTIEKFEDEAKKAQFAIVLLSPDDVGRSKSSGDDCNRPRARQNVILELGYFIGQLGRNKVAALHKGPDLELPSDYVGVMFIKYDDSKSFTWKAELAKELNAAGFEIDLNQALR